MDQANHAAEDAHLPAQGPFLRLRTADELPADFVPLRLLLQPGSAVVEVDRPDTLIGRHTEADVRLPLPDVSRRHCRLVFVDGGWQVIDLNSLNGIKVNGEKVLEAPLEQGDLLSIGGFTFMVDLARSNGISEKTGHVESILKTLTSGSQRQAS